MITTYSITMENDVSLEIPAASAGEAIFLACHRVRGYGVRSCFSGTNGAHKLKEPQLFDTYGGGHIMFEVPKHDPLPFEPTPGRQKMCACYVRIGDVLELDVFDYLVERIHQLPLKLLFDVRDMKSGLISSVDMKGEKIISVVRAATFEANVPAHCSR